MNKVEAAQMKWIDQKRDEYVAYTESSLSNDAVVLEHFGDRIAQLGREWRHCMRIMDCLTGLEPSGRTVVETICDAFDDMGLHGASIIREAAMQSLQGEQ